MALEIVHAKGIYLLEGSAKEQRALPKRARFAWHAGPGRDPSYCAACIACAPSGRWFTTREDRVLDLAILVSHTPGMAPLDCRDDRLQTKADRAIAEAEVQVDWLSRLDSRGDE